MLTSAAKYRQNRAVSSNAAYDAWKESKPHLELNDRPVGLDDVPVPCPESQVIVDDLDRKERLGVAVAIPAPSVDKATFVRVARYMRSLGFELRTVDNSWVHSERYVRYWVRMCDAPLRGQRYSAKAWLEWATRKHEELYAS